MKRVRLFAIGYMLLLCAMPLAWGQADDSVKLIAFDKPFTFAYLAWEKKVTIENDEVVLNAEGLTSKGGAGVVVNLDFSRHAEESPALMITVGPRNTMKSLRLFVQDTSKNTATWHFPLPVSSDHPTLILPVDSASIAEANEQTATAPDLTKLMQWQLIGDWSTDGPVDIHVLGVVGIKPTAAMRAQREQRIKRAEQTRQEALKERLESRAKYSRRTVESPELVAIYAAAPDVLALQIRQGRITSPCKLTEYMQQPGDIKDKNNRLIRNGVESGLLIGPPGKESGLVSTEGFSGDPLLLTEADDAANYTVRSQDDPAFAPSVAPVKVMRKSTVEDWRQPLQGDVVVCHRIYLKLPHPLRVGKTYTVSLSNVNTNKSTVSLRFTPDTVWSESVHVSQVGFRPDDPCKQAFLSFWAGTGGAYPFPEKLAFHLVDTKTEKTVYHGAVGETWPADRPEKMEAERNFNLTNVSRIDFSDFKTPGAYRLVVDNIGCSYPFSIGEQTWEKAFWVQMKGFYNERSGIALGPPYTDFVRPVCWKPGVNGCMPITQSTYSIVDGNPDGKGNLASGDTGKPVPEAWGGYHDAGDWNPRRLDHMTTTTFWQLELLQLFPNYFRTLKLNIPDDNPGPDLLKECLFELDLYRRLQMPDGGCRFGIETDGDPSCGEVSWKQHMPGYVYAPDIYSSYLYAAIAGRAAQVLEAYDAKLASIYRKSALKAMQWAEADRARRIAKGVWNRIPMHQEDIYRARNLAAVCLYALTKDAHWNSVFLEETVLKTNASPSFRGDFLGRSAAFTYGRLPEGMGDPQVKQNARHAIIADADGSLAYQQNNAFGIASDDPGKPQFIGFYSNPHGAISLVRAHYFTHAPKYIAGAVRACLFPAGANPSNIAYTSGIGTHSVKAMNMDSLATGQKTPIGLTPYGNIDLQKWSDNGIVWPLGMFGSKIQPAAFEWPTTEAYWDVRFWPMYCEFCVDQTMGPNAYVWGYLAARK